MKGKYITTLLLLAIASNNQHAATNLFPAEKKAEIKCQKTVWDKNARVNTIITLHDEFFNVFARLQ